MREYLNNILVWIGSSTLTDDEFDSISLSDYGLNVATYNALDKVLESRESVSDMRDRLSFYFRSKGVEITPNSQGKTNIFVGSPL